jgi:hypothetical protein
MELTTLWDGDKAHLPLKLTSLYIDELHAINMFEHARDFDRKKTRNGAVGGISQEETYEHFAECFANSCIRLQYVLIDPNDKFGEVPTNFFSTFSTGSIALLDAPCGTGAGALSLLYTIKELRKNKKLPTLPLEVNILACDYSESALNLYSKLLDEAIPAFKTVNIKVTYNVKQWDAFEVSSTVLLMREFTGYSCDEFFVLVSAFSGIQSDDLEKLTNSLMHIQSSLSPDKYTLVHVEPNSNNAKRFFTSIRNMMKSLFNKLSNYREHICDDRFHWLDPVNGKNVLSTVRVSLNSRNK